ncbi:hypothetical protein ACQEU3_26825 [Spirillospora sp. CA-253888]
MNRAPNACTDRVQGAAGRFMRVIGLLDRPTALMRPAILASALRPYSGGRTADVSRRTTTERDR